MEHIQSVAQLERRILRSPFPGVVLNVNLSPGALVDTSETKKAILKLVQTDKLRVESYIPLRFFNRIQPGHDVLIQPEASLAAAFKARVTTVDRLIDSASGTFGVVVNLDNRSSTTPVGSRCKMAFAGVN